MLLLPVAIVFVRVGYGASGQKTAIASVPAGTSTAAEEKAAVKYAYKPAGRRDPFAPIIEKIVKKSRGERPPLERHNIGDFTLSGIIWGGFGYNAILEGPDGKGYFVKVGTLLGPNGGVIRRINKNNLVVEEKYRNYAGKTERKEIVMQLRRKQEEKL